MSIRQVGSKMCFVCGFANPIGLKVEFYSDGDSCWTEFTPGEEHQGWPGQLHGGIISTLLDETLGRSAYVRDIWTLTARLEVRYRKYPHLLPAPAHISSISSHMQRFPRRSGSLIFPVALPAPILPAL